VRAKGEGAYWQRPNGTWRYRILVEKRRIDGTGATRKEAKVNALAKLHREGPRSTTVTVNDLFAEWHASGLQAAGLRPTTFDQYVSLLRVWVIPTLGDTQVRNLTRNDVAKCVATWTGSASSRRSIYAAFSKLIDHAVSLGILNSNVVRQVPRPAAPEPRHRDVPDDSFPRLLSASDGHRWEIAVWLAFAAGLRRGEILGLQWSDISASTITISNRGNITRSSQGLRQGPPKTRAGVRQIHVSEALDRALSRHKAMQTQMRLAAPVWTPSDFVLTTHIGGPVEPRALSRAWRGWARTAGLPDKGIHVGRHYASTHMLASGEASVADVAATMGHDPAVLLHTYAAAVATSQRRATDALGETLTRQSGVTFGVTSRKQARARKESH
jgi:integrase